MRIISFTVMTPSYHSLIPGSDLKPTPKNEILQEFDSLHSATKRKLRVNRP